jgi:hypothetical protein
VEAVLLEAVLHRLVPKILVVYQAPPQLVAKSQAVQTPLPTSKAAPLHAGQVEHRMAKSAAIRVSHRMARRWSHLAVAHYLLALLRHEK